MLILSEGILDESEKDKGRIKHNILNTMTIIEEEKKKKRRKGDVPRIHSNCPKCIV